MRLLILFLRLVSCALLAGLILTPFLQIIMRGVFSVPMASAEEVARALLAILSLPSMTGQMIALDGGQHLQWSPSFGQEPLE